MNKSLRVVIQNGPNRWSRILGHAKLYGEPVRVRMRITPIGSVVFEYNDATRDSDGWHQLGGSYSSGMTFGCALQTLPCIARLDMTPVILEEIATSAEVRA